MSGRVSEQPFVTKTAMVLRAITDHPGEVIYRDSIVNETGLDEREVRATIANIRQTGQKSPSPNHPGKFIEIVARGQAWLYRPNPGVGPVPTVAPRQRAVIPGIQLPVVPEVVEPPKPIAKSTSDVFEKVGRTDRHEIVVKDESGKLFKVVPL